MDKKISELSVATTLTGTELLPIVQGGETKKLTINNLMSGTTNYLPKFTGASTLGNSSIFDNGTKVGIGTQPFPSEDVQFYVNKTSSSTVARGLQSYVDFSGNYGATALDAVVKVNSSTNYNHIAVNQNNFIIGGSAVPSTGIYTITADGTYNGTNVAPLAALIKIGNIDGTGTVTDKYGIYQTSNLKNFFGGNIFTGQKVGIGVSSSATPSFALTINDLTNPIVDYQIAGTNFAYTGRAGAMFSGGATGFAISVNEGQPIILGSDGVRFATFASSGNVGINESNPTSKLHVSGLSEYTTNALAIAGGLTVGAFYHTAGVLKVVI
jgi:hypothetical protein